MSLLPTQSTCLPDFCAILQTLWPRTNSAQILLEEKSVYFAFGLASPPLVLPFLMLTRWATKYAFEMVSIGFSQSESFAVTLDIGADVYAS